MPFHLRNASDDTLCFVEIENLNLLTQSALNFFFYWPVKLEHLETTELDEVTLSAYITIALLEMPLPVTVSVLAKALLWMQ